MRTPEHLITLPATGLRIIPPMETQRNMTFAKSGILAELGNTMIWSENEKTRLQLLKSNPIYKKRFPQRESGDAYMEAIDYERREKLLEYAIDLTDTIQSSWESINASKPLAVILFGSVATGLVKGCDSPCPSNIDLAVISAFTQEERDQLYDGIRDKRHEIQERILADCRDITSTEANPGNAGVTIQHVAKVVKNGFSGALEYIASSATVLHDPDFLWWTVELHALKTYREKQQSKKRSGIIYQKGK